MRWMNKKFILIKLILVLSLLLTGCWDKVEIDDRAFIMGLGLDKADNVIKATYVFPNLPVITGQGGGGDNNFIKETKGKTLLEANEKINNISNRRITFDHTKVIVLGESFLQDPDAIKMTFDYFARSPEYALSLLLVATDTEASKLLQTQPNAEEPVGIYAFEMFEGDQENELSNIKMTLLNFITGIEESEGVGVLPILNVKEKEVSLDGLMVLKEYKKSLKLSLEQIMPYNWLRGKGKGIYISKKETLDVKNISYKISEIQREVTFKKTNKGLTINISIWTEGDIIEFKLKKEEEKKNVFSEKAIEDIEKAIKEGMESDMMEVLELVQKDVGVDLIELSKDFKIKEGKLWEEVKDNWNEYFASANIQIEVFPNVRRIGMTK